MAFQIDEIQVDFIKRQAMESEKKFVTRSQSSPHRDEMMKKTELKAIIVKGEDSRLQFKQALAAWPEIDFIDDRDGCLFTVIRTPEANVCKECDMKSLSRAEGTI